ADGEVMLTWMPVTGATKYQYAYARTGSAMGAWMPEDGQSTMSATVGDLTNGMEYTFYVRAGNDAGYGEAGMDTATPMAAVEAPGAPTNLTATGGDEQVMLSWEAPADGGEPTGYQYQYGTGNLMSDWMPETPQTGMTATVTGLINGTTYMFKVRAVNAAGPGPATDAVTATPGEPLALPGVPRNLEAEPGNAEVTLTWEAPSDGGAVASYEYDMAASGDWMPAGTGLMKTVENLTNGTPYVFRVRAVNATGPGDATEAVTATPRAVERVLRGNIKELKLVGAAVTDKTIARVPRHHVPEGSQGVDLQATVTWTNKEIEDIGYNTPQWIYVEIETRRGEQLPPWVSWVDDNGPSTNVGSQDVHFTRTSGDDYGWLRVTTPRETQIPERERGDSRLTQEVPSSKLRVVFIEDDQEAENDAFYIRAYGGNVNLGGGRGREGETYVDRTMDVVIEDDEEQRVRIYPRSGAERGSTAGGHTYVYEPAGDPETQDPVFTVDASPPRNELPLAVRLDMVDLEGVTVSSGEISLSKSSMTLNSDRSGTRESNRDYVTVHLPDSDGNRKDDDYELHASVNVYSVSSGGFELNPSGSHQITVIDRHKLPHLTVSPKTGMVTEGGEPLELSLTLDRSPRTTRAVPPGSRRTTT
ncbi:MAG: fibronectin type III domain-containing protein, partial [Rhodococcus sp.]|nr:fibronectin type III domain-containing protein [Rhodococcus sp. (in: high G+C Gram-positive bacteria)]